MRLLWVLSFIFFLSSGASAKTEAELLLEVQVGTEWGKHVASKMLPNLPNHLSRVAHGVAEFKRGSAFIIRTSDPKRVILATNAHVMVDDNDVLAGDLGPYKGNLELACHDRDTMSEPVEKVRLGLLGITGRCKKVIGIWPSVDFALFEAEFSDVDASVLNAYAVDLPAKNKIEFGQQLAMFGFGHFLNPGDPELDLMYIRDKDCQVFSATNDFRYISDPDEYSPAKYKVWSFVLGCDVSWGDSGAPILDLMTGHLAGIIFTGKYPKNQNISLNASAMDRLRATPQETAWSNLNFGVPISKIIEIVRGQSWPESAGVL